MSSFDDDEALFEDIYGEDDNVDTGKELAPNENKDKPSELNDGPTKKDDAEEQTEQESQNETSQSESLAQSNTESQAESNRNADNLGTQNQNQNQTSYNSNNNQSHQQNNQHTGESQPRNEFYSRDQGKMFIGGLNWDTTEEGLRDYFSKYGEIIDFTIMRDGANGKSRGFGFLTFKESSSVDEVLKTDHILDGKLIDPKRAIPREEQDKTGKIFVGGIGPEVNEKDFNDFFSTFGNVIDAQLMIDKDTGRSRGFGFVTYDSPDAVDRVTVSKYLTLKGKAMEVKRAEPRGQQSNNYNRGGGYQSSYQQHQQQPQSYQQSYQQSMGMGGYNNMGNMANGMGAMTPEMMAQYWQQMQQWYTAQYQQTGMPQQFQQFQQMAGQQPQLPLNPQQQQQPVAPQSQQSSGSTYYEDQPPPPPPNPQRRAPESTHDDKKSPPPNAPKGPKAAPAPRNFQRNRGSRGRGSYHPYSRRP